MIIPDTSIWIEFLRKNEPVFSVMKDLLENREILGMECVFGELLQGIKNKKEKDIILQYWKYILKYEEKGIWLEAGIHSSEHNLIDKGVGLIDAGIIIFAKKNNAKIWTLDKKLSAVLNNGEKFFKR